MQYERMWSARFAGKWFRMCFVGYDMCFECAAEQVINMDGFRLHNKRFGLLAEIL